MRKAMNQMQDRYNEMLLRQATEKISSTPNPTKEHTPLVHSKTAVVGMDPSLRKSLDDNLLDEGIGTNDQDIIEKLL